MYINNEMFINLIQIFFYSISISFNIYISSKKIYYTLISIFLLFTNILISIRFIYSNKKLIILDLLKFIFFSASTIVTVWQVIENQEFIILDIFYAYISIVGMSVFIEIFLLLN